MEDAIISENYEIIVERMKADDLLGKNRAPLFRSEDDFCRYCEPIIRDYEMKTLRTEVMTLETFTNRHQERFNIIGSVHKVFFEETPYGKNINICILNIYFRRFMMLPRTET